MTERLNRCLEALKARKEGAFVPFLVIGDPNIDLSFSLAETLIENGADILEFGFAFSDPPADGPVIQAADQRALGSKVSVDQAFDYLERVRAHSDIPIALLVYYNLILSQGVDRFYQRAQKAGVDAILIADVPVEEAEVSVSAARDTGIAPIFIVSELTTNARLAMIAKQAEGYLYLVSRIGITGERQVVSPGLELTMKRIRAQTQIPVLAGFGISSPEQVQSVMRAGTEGVICGSAVVRRISDHLDEPDKMRQSIGEFSSAMKAATRNALKAVRPVYKI